ncbi:hypothetical protein K7X08_025576 [Anisodus acutangulus]|uniref:Uncharacterized protein n=1 Tax=Anisodus acutangulus TaxID=402998 RepID=A0A9Q1LUA7_9SOLA|nr:hypothetical protein K7X08_025576 [Anisodus acutangulus]
MGKEEFIDFWEENFGVSSEGGRRDVEEERVGLRMGVAFGSAGNHYCGFNLRFFPRRSSSVERAIAFGSAGINCAESHSSSVERVVAFGSAGTYYCGSNLLSVYVCTVSVAFGSAESTNELLHLGRPESTHSSSVERAIAFGSAGIKYDYTRARSRCCSVGSPVV